MHLRYVMGVAKRTHDMNVTTIASLLILLKAHAHAFACFIPRVSWTAKNQLQEAIIEPFFVYELL